MGGFPSWLIGVALSLSGCTLSNLGVNWQKLAHDKLTKPGNENKSIVSEPTWILGMSSLIIGSLADLVSFGFADMSLLAPLGAMTLVINMFIAPCFLGEKLTSKDIKYTIVILVGTILSICFGSKSDTEYTLEDLLHLYAQPTFIVYIFLFVIYVISMIVLMKKLQKRIGTHAEKKYDKRIRNVLFPSMAGAFGAHSVLFSKSSAEIVKSTISGRNQFTSPISYLLIVLLVFFLVMQMRLLNKGLEKADALLVVPVYQVSWVIMNTVVAMVYFQDYKNMASHEIFIFVVGVLITLDGVYRLSKREPTGGSRRSRSNSLSLSLSVGGSGSNTPTSGSAPSTPRSMTRRSTMLYGWLDRTARATTPDEDEELPLQAPDGLEPLSLAELSSEAGVAMQSLKDVPVTPATSSSSKPSTPTMMTMGGLAGGSSSSSSPSSSSPSSSSLNRSLSAAVLTIPEPPHRLEENVTQSLLLQSDQPSPITGPQTSLSLGSSSSHDMPILSIISQHEGDGSSSSSGSSGSSALSVGGGGFDPFLQPPVAGGNLISSTGKGQYVFSAAAVLAEADREEGSVEAAAAAGKHGTGRLVAPLSVPSAGTAAEEENAWAVVTDRQRVELA